MKLLLDQNLSFRLITKLASSFPNSKHIRDYELSNADDLSIWDFAKRFNFIILTKDTDFLQMSLLYGHPPKVVRLCVGNCSTDQIFQLLEKKKKNIFSFINNPQEALLLL